MEACDHPKRSEEQQDELEASASAELKRLSAAAVKAMSQRDWSFDQTPEAKEVLDHIDPAWQGEFDNYPGWLTLPENVAAHRELFAQHPTAWYEVQSMSVDLDPGLLSASVILEIAVRNMDSVTMRVYGEFRWRRVGWKWLWYRGKAMRTLAMDALS